MNRLLKTMAAFVLAVGMIPVYVYTAEETTAVQAITEEEASSRDRQNEGVANSKLALALSGMTLGAISSIAAGVATKSALVSGIIGIPLFVVPAATYCYLRDKYKNMFDEEAYKRVCDTEDKTFLYTMTTLTAPMAVMLVGGIASGYLYISGGFGYCIGGILGTAIGKIATIVDATKEAATIAAIGLVPVVPAILETKDELEKQRLAQEKHGSSYTLSIPEKIGCFFQKYCKNFAYASAVLGAASYAYARA